MRFTTASGALLAAAATANAASSTLAPVSVVGNKFFNEDGSQFFMKGIAYQLSQDDPLVDGDQCARDVQLMKTLGTNTIRVYHVDPTANHDSCMSAFASAGIYTLIDLDTFNTYIMDPTMAAPSWNGTQFGQFAAVMDTFSSYTNVLGFFVGNEVIALTNQSIAAPYVKAAAHDMKAYRDSKGYRKIPIGYSAADIAELRPMLQDYLTCGGNEADNIDFFSLNSYEWCDPSTFTTSGYANLEKQALNFPVPLFFSETGCNVPGPRLFEDQASILGPDMDSNWCGAIVYEWIQEANNYGLISYGDGSASDDAPRSGTPKPITPDFANLKSQWATLHPTGVKSADYNPSSVSTRDCPASTAGGWEIDGNVPIPTLDSSVIAAGSKASGGGASYTLATATASGGAADKTSTGSSSSTSSGATSSAKSSASSLSPKSLSVFNREFTVAGAALVGVMMVFTLWL
ncbi:hypothetical protein SPBR_03733 [Sporothrix brasiliensis 5110]|uniref:1,3-beta-glucanosyltransferase n=1 Tax=Sporothrix brasiliensis 5110 TaxID=1398154 RepID=A0A0C2FUM1_9PEZI|nr:uncharacterized protein SPBR_03733 [Sporothrix brasiliensis 5110]KIH94698.1 hypothetical protein SPBR_03733 [Sporothrix brasiliensis 5110]